MMKMFVPIPSLWTYCSLLIFSTGIKHKILNIRCSGYFPDLRTFCGQREAPVQVNEGARQALPAQQQPPVPGAQGGIKIHSLYKILCEARDRVYLGTQVKLTIKIRIRLSLKLLSGKQKKVHYSHNHLCFRFLL